MLSMLLAFLSLFRNRLLFCLVLRVPRRNNFGMLPSGPLSLFVPHFDSSYLSPTPLKWLASCGLPCRYFGACKQKGVVPAVDCAADGEDGLENLRAILSTGSPLLPEHFQWIYEVTKNN